MTTGERRLEIIRILTARRRETMRNLARELGVTTRTIRTDILVLTADYPLETRRGNGGCVKVAEWFHPHRNILTAEQQRVLSQMIVIGDERQAKVLRELLVEYGSPKSRQTQREENHAGSTFEHAHSGRARPAPDGISTP